MGDPVVEGRRDQDGLLLSGCPSGSISRAAVEETTAAGGVRADQGSAAVPARGGRRQEQDAPHLGSLSLCLRVRIMCDENASLGAFCIAAGYALCSLV